MKFVCDEGVDRQIVDALRGAGHDVAYVAEMKPGIGDDEVLQLAVRDQRVLITADKDFGELVFRQNRVHHGIVLLRLHGLSSAEKCALAVSSVTEHGGEFEHSFAVLEKDRLRIRKRAS